MTVVQSGSVARGGGVPGFLNHPRHLGVVLKLFGRYVYRFAHFGIRGGEVSPVPIIAQLDGHFPGLGT